MPHPNLEQWIFLSAVEFFRQRIEIDAELKYFVEGEHRSTDKDLEYVEFRMDGPSSEEVSKNYWFHNVEINLAISVIKNEDIGRIHKIGGQVKAGFNKEIPVFKYGKDTDPENNGSLIGCLQLRTDFRERAIVLAHFGQLDPNLNILQATVEGHFRLTLCED